MRSRAVHMHVSLACARSVCAASNAYHTYWRAYLLEYLAGFSTLV